MPTSMNPLKQLRLSERLTLEDLSLLAGVSRLLIIRNEQGCYRSPSPKLLNCLIVTDSFDFHYNSSADLIDLYESFQTETRKFNFGKLTIPHVFTINSDFNFNPVTQWRESSGLSKSQISTLFCIHPAVVSRIENQPHLVPHSLPKEFTDALLDAGYSKNLLDLLNESFAAYRSSRNSTALAVGI